MDAKDTHSKPVPFRLADESMPIGAPLFHAAWLFAIGIVIAQFVWLRPAWILVGFCPIAIVTGIAGLRAQRIAWIPLGALWCLLGIWCAEMQPQPAPDPGLNSLSNGLIRTIEGTVIDAAAVRDGSQEEADELAEDGPSQRIDLKVSTIEVVSDTEDVQRRESGVIRMTVRWRTGEPAPRGFGCGQKIRADARLTLPTVYRDPGAWNYRDYLLEQGITATATVKAEAVSVVGEPELKTFACRISGWQHMASARLMAIPAAMRGLPPLLRLSEDDSIMLAAMVTGDRTYLTHSLRAGFERTGSFHMLVVSGLHLGIVAASIFWVARRLRLPQFPATLITISMSLAYALFTGFATPVQRSLWMVSLYLAGRLVYRQRNVLNTIGFASLCLLVTSPRALFESSLQMTVLAVVSIGGIAVPILEKTVHPYLNAARDLQLTAIDVKLPMREAGFRVILRMFATALSKAVAKPVGWRLFPFFVRTVLRCVEALAVSCVVELAMALPMAVYFHRITVFALPVNMMILPLLVLLVPTALLTLIAASISTSVAVTPAIVTSLLLHAGVRLIHAFAAIPTGDFRIPLPLPGQIAAFCAFASAAIILAWRGNTNDSRWLRRGAWMALVLAATCVVVPRPVDHPHNALLVEAIDVGQGDSLLIVTADGKTLLVDGGGFSGGPRQVATNFDVGEEVVSPVLWSRGIRHLDVVALSHAHSDHMSGLPAVIQNFKPDELWVGDNPPVEPYVSLIREAQELGIRIRSMHSGDSATLGSAEVRALAPLPDYKPGFQPVNNDSLVLQVAYRSASVLLEGDAEAAIERGMLSERGLESTLLKVGHHGSTTSTQPDFLARVSPRFAIISCGLHNHYGHPRPEVLQSLESSRVRAFSTDINGATCFTLDGTNVAAEAFCGMQR